MDSDDESGSFEFDRSEEMYDSTCHSGMVPSFESLKPEEIVKMMVESIDHVNSIVEVSFTPVAPCTAHKCNLQQQTPIIG